MRVYVVKHTDVYDVESNRAVFSTRERALEYLADKTIEIYHHVGIYEEYGRCKPYDEWRCSMYPYRANAVRHEITERMTVGVTERDGHVGYFAPNGMRVLADGEDYEIEEFEVDHV